MKRLDEVEGGRGGEDERNRFAEELRIAHRLSAAEADLAIAQREAREAEDLPAVAGRARR